MGSSNTPDGASGSGVPTDQVSDRQGAPSQERDPNVRLARLALISDTHVSADFPVSSEHWRSAFAAIRSLDPAPDAIAINGDITDHGTEEEYDLVKELSHEAGFAFPDDFILAMGNHEQRGGFEEHTAETYQVQREIFLARSGLANLYYTTQVNSIPIVVLGPDVDPSFWDRFKLSDKQIAWLGDTLDEQGRFGLPVFVFLHQPLDNTVPHTHEGERKHGTNESSAALAEALKGRTNVALVTGHTHAPCNVSRPDPAGPLQVSDSAVGYVRFNAAPTDDYDDGTLYSAGMTVDVFADRAEFTVWDYVAGTPAGPEVHPFS